MPNTDDLPTGAPQPGISVEGLSTPHTLAEEATGKGRRATVMRGTTDTMQPGKIPVDTRGGN